MNAVAAPNTATSSDEASAVKRYTEDTTLRSTTVRISVNPNVGDMAVVDLGNVDLSGGTFRLVNLKLGSVGVLISSDKMAELDRLTEMVAEARGLLTNNERQDRPGAAAKVGRPDYSDLGADRP